jgi:hypothetical protein
MAVMRGIQKAFVNEIKDDGVATQKELDGHESGFTHAPLPTEMDDKKFIRTVDGESVWSEVDLLSTGWKDNIVQLSSMNSGDILQAPLLADTGDGMWSYLFRDDGYNYVFADIHINHDYKPGTKVYPHLHWTPLSTSTGTVRWSMEYKFARGHGQGDSFLIPPTVLVIEQNGKGLTGEHMVAECSDSDAFIVPEPDTIVRIKVARDGSHANDTFYGSVAGLMLDLHYQSDRETTVNKAPDFYGEPA